MASLAKLVDLAQLIYRVFRDQRGRMAKAIVNCTRDDKVLIPLPEGGLTDDQQLTILGAIHDEYSPSVIKFCPFDLGGQISTPDDADAEPGELFDARLQAIRFAGLRSNVKDLTPVELHAIYGFIRRFRAGTLPENEPTVDQRNLTDASRPNTADRNDIENDNGKNLKKNWRPLNSEAKACIRLFKAERKTDPTISIKAVVESYCEENGESVTGILKRLNANPDAWKPKAKLRSKNDKKTTRSKLSRR